VDPSVVAPLVAFLVMVVVLAIVIRRTGRVIADTREAETFRRAIEDLARRVDYSMAGVTEAIDQVRHHEVRPSEIAEHLAAALDGVRRYGEEVRALDGPASIARLRDGLTAELERADRALEMVEYGCGILEGSRGAGPDVEGEMAVKRGYLNLLHAREAIAEYAAQIVAMDHGADARWYSRRHRA
jgi:hypothetical protein